MKSLERTLEARSVVACIAAVSIALLFWQLGLVNFVDKNTPPLKGDVVLFEDFLGSTIDQTKWAVLNRLSDQANNEINCLVPENVTVTNGMLEGVSKYEEHRCGDSLEAPKLMKYTSWQIQQTTAPFLYGRIDVRAKVPGGIGIWPTIFLLGFEWQASQPQTANVIGHKWPYAGWCEIDIAEFWQGDRSKVNNTVHYNGNGGLHLGELGFNSSVKFATYRLDWTKHGLIWSVDAEDGRGFQQLRSVWNAKKVPDVPMYLVINAAIGGTGGGDPDSRTFPQTFQIDYIRVTQ